MALDSGNVRVAATGGVYVAPTGTTLPTNATSAINAAFDDMGYIDEGGVTEGQGTQSNDIRAWQLGAVVRKVRTQHDLTYSFTALETRDTVLEQFYGNYDPATGKVEVTGAIAERNVWVISYVDDDDVVRIVLPDAEVSDIGDVVYLGTDAVKYPFVLTAYPDASGVKAYIYFHTDGAS